jgi:hypothetical protein
MSIYINIYIYIYIYIYVNIYIHIGTSLEPNSQNKSEAADYDNDYPDFPNSSTNMVNDIEPGDNNLALAELISHTGHLLLLLLIFSYYY